MVSLKDVKGVVVAMVTPFTQKGEVDIEGLRRLTSWLVESGVDGLFPLGSIGEGPKLDRAERDKVSKIVLDEVKSNLPVLVGAGGITTKDALIYAKDAKDRGASAAVIHPPWYFHPTPKALLNHYKTIAETVDFPIILYNIPPFAGYSIPIEIVVEAAKIDNIVGIKDSSADILYYQALLDQVPGEFDVMQGYGALFLPSLFLGGRTTLCAEANITPKTVVEMYRSYLAEEYEKARRLHFKLAKLVSAIVYGDFPVAVKEAMNMLNLPGGYTLQPVNILNEQEKENIRRILKEIGLS